MDTGANYQSSQWLEKQQKGSRRSKFVVCLRLASALSRISHSSHVQVIGSLVALVALVAVGVVLGVVLSKHHSSSSSSTSSAASSDGATGAVNQTNPNDPSTFIKDPNLKHSFWGLAYTPAGSQLPNCGNSLGQ
jgi:hypothetical protein